MLKSIINGFGNGFGRAIGRIIALALIGFLVYLYLSSKGVSLPNLNIEEVMT